MATIFQNWSQTWLLNTSQIQPGYSAVLGENMFVFYMIHFVAISLIMTSLISCAFVIISILSQLRKDKRWDFSDRFPLYLAIADFLWGISHLTDHLAMVLTQKYPNVIVATFLSINLWFFLGYQQLMHAGLAIYIYIKVVCRNSFDLGKLEWKLHVFCVTIMALSIAVFYPLGSFGCTGFWLLHDIQTTPGLILGFYVATSTTLLAFCTTVGYKSIQKVIKVQKEAMVIHQEKAAAKSNSKAPRHHSIATKCLTTFVRISVALYCTLAVAYWAFVWESFFGFLEPVTILVIVIVANSSGWANTLGYFYNQRLKVKRKASLAHNITIQTLSSTSNYSSR